MLIHRHSWTVQELAEYAGTSRSSFAMRFKQPAGVAVMEYLIRWRMLLAADRLANSSDTVAEIALSRLRIRERVRLRI